MIEMANSKLPVLHIEAADDRDAFDQRISSIPYGEVEHTWGWGELRRVLGWRPIRKLVTVGKGQTFPLSLSVKQIPLLPFAVGLIQASPPVKAQTEDWELYLAALGEIARREKLVAVSITASRFKGEDDYPKSLSSDIRLTPARLVQRERKTVVVNLTADEDRLFKQMSSDQRRYTRKAIRSGLKVRIADTVKDMELFFGIYEEMCARKQLLPFPQSYFKVMREELALRQQVRLFLVESEEEVHGGTIVCCHPCSYTLLFSAHNTGGENLGASRLLEWEIMRDGIARGLSFYDLGGIPYDSSEDRREAKGVAFWKMGFGSVVKHYSASCDLVVRPRLYSLMCGLNAGQLYRTLKARLGRRL